MDTCGRQRLRPDSAGPTGLGRPNRGVAWAAALLTACLLLGMWPAGQVQAAQPPQPVTRAGLAALLAVAFGLVDPTPTKAPFADVRPDAPQAGAIAAVAAEGWMVGVGGGRFAPRLPATRAEAAAALARALRLPPPASSSRPRVWTDQSAIPPWARGPLAAAAAAGLLRGYPDGTFRAGTPLSPSQAETLLRRARRLAPPPSAPGGMRLTTYENRVDVGWRPVPRAASYTIERRAAGGPWVAVASTRDLVWGDRGAKPAVAYRYRVRAVGAAGTASPPGAAVAEPPLSAAEASWTAPLHFSVATLLGLRQAEASGPGTALGLGGLRLPDLPPLPFARVDPPEGTLFFSDAPETVTAPAVLAQADVSGGVRAVFDLVNATGAAAEFALVLVDPGPGTVAYAVYQGFEADSGGPAAEGVRLSAHLVAPPASAATGPCQRGELHPGGAVALDPVSPTIQPGANLVGTYDVAVSPGATLAAVLAPAPWDAASYFRAHRLPLADAGTGGGAGRGAFSAGTTRTFDIAPPVGLPAELMLADGHADPFLGPHDVATSATGAQGSAASARSQQRDFGNYGVTYRIEGRPAVATAVIGVPLGGRYLGAVGVDGHAFPAPSRPVPADGSTGFLLARWPAGRRSQIDWTPPAGSDLPLMVVTVPLTAADASSGPPGSGPGGPGGARRAGGAS